MYLRYNQNTSLEVSLQDEGRIPWSSYPSLRSGARDWVIYPAYFSISRYKEFISANDVGFSNAAAFYIYSLLHNIILTDRLPHYSVFCVVLDQLISAKSTRVSLGPCTTNDRCATYQFLVLHYRKCYILVWLFYFDSKFYCGLNIHVLHMVFISGLQKV